MTRLRALRTAVLLGALALSACGGGGSSSSAPDSMPGGGNEELMPGDPFEGTDTLRATSLYSRWSVSDGNTTVNDTEVDTMTCTGAACTDSQGVATTIADLRTDSAGTGAQASTQAGMRGGLDTAMIRSTLSGGVMATSFGFWGEHGSAVLVRTQGPLSVTVEGDAFTGEFTGVQAWALGEASASGSNPTGTGRAVWQGIAEAASTGTYTRLAGTATLTIADLSQPRVGVEITVPGHAINAPGWGAISLINGAFATGTAGSDLLSGSFHGPRHGEAWGIFDTGAYVGAFGAKRMP